MPRETICVYCEKPIVGRCSRAKFCSTRCRDKAWHAAHPEWRKKDYQKNKARRKPAAVAYVAKNRDRLLAAAKAWKAEHSGMVQACTLRSQYRRYGITVADYERMLADQDGRCLLCGTNSPAASRVKRFVVDHDHDSGKVRGLLCNRAIGLLRESPALLRYAAAYVERQGSGVTAYAA